MIDPWSLFDDAIALPRQARLAALREVKLALAEDARASSGDGLELEAAVECALAELGAAPLDSAILAVAAAAAHGRLGWPNYYLTLASIEHGRYRLALQAFGRIPPLYFEDRSLQWRQVHLWELAAIANLGLDQIAEARTLIDKIVAALATRGDVDDLAAPKDLIERLLIYENLSTRRDLLQRIETSIDLNVWFDSTTIERIAAASA